MSRGIIAYPAATRSSRIELLRDLAHHVPSGEAPISRSSGDSLWRTNLLIASIAEILGRRESRKDGN